MPNLLKKLFQRKPAIWVQFILALVGFILLLSWYLLSFVRCPKVVYIPKGSVFTTIEHLQDEGVRVHLIDAVILHFLGQPQQGWIDLRENKFTRIAFLYRLTTAKATTAQVTLIPGETTTIFLDQLAKHLLLDTHKLHSIYAELERVPEGILVPNTYSIPKASTEKEVLSYLLTRSQEQQQKLAVELIGEYDEAKWLQIVTLASIIQKEAASIDDMPMVSSVIQNRLAKKMRLQMDGTLNYGEFSHQKVTSQRIRSDKTPYNTYKHRGLPDFPVCTVSKAALIAALHPKQTNYLYFVRGKNGEHIYTSYFSTHKENILNATN
jgi:UPF0755 protein